MEVVAHGWNTPVQQLDATKILTTKFKNLRKVLRAWQSQLSSFKTNITNVKVIIIFLGILEEFWRNSETYLWWNGISGCCYMKNIDLCCNNK
jgi:threonine/homoserine/homoserine lactone efflux protein